MRRDDDQPDQDQGWVEKREGPSGKLIAAGIIAVLLLFFVLQNTDDAHIDFLFLDGTFPLWVVIVAVAFLGFAAGWLLGRSRRRDRERHD